LSRSDWDYMRYVHIKTQKWKVQEWKSDYIKKSA
jgi:hypothetical protein